MRVAPRDDELGCRRPVPARRPEEHADAWLERCTGNAQTIDMAGWGPKSVHGG